jgi:hypothetical protein
LGHLLVGEHASEFLAPQLDLIAEAVALHLRDVRLGLQGG